MADRPQDFNPPNAKQADEIEPTHQQPDASLKELLNECGKFRILILGQSGVGKSTICAKVFGISPKMAGASFKAVGTRREQVWDGISLPGVNEDLIIHDSGGFEAGDADASVNEIRRFIDFRKSQRTLSEQLHCIWYCISCAADRPIVAIEEKFFAEVDTGDIPVLVVFTKFDALESQEEKKIRRRWRRDHPGLPLPTDLEERAHDAAVRVYDEKLRPSVERIIGFKKSRVGIERVSVPDAEEEVEHVLDKDTQAAINGLVTSTLERLTQDGLKLLLVAAQRQVADAKIQQSIELDLGIFWKVKAPTSIPFLPFIGAAAIYSAFNKIMASTTTQWGLNDPSNLLWDTNVRNWFLEACLNVGVAGRLGLSFLLAINFCGAATEVATTGVVLKLIAGSILIHERLFWAQKATSFAPLTRMAVWAAAHEYRSSEMRRHVVARIEHVLDPANCYSRAKCQQLLEVAIALGRK